MRLPLLVVSPLLLASSLLHAQQTQTATDASAPVTPQSVPANVKPQAAPAAQAAPDAIARGNAEAAERARKDAEKQSKYLRLQDNEIVAASFDEAGNAVKLPPCAKDDQACQEKRKELLKQKRVELNVKNGTLTIDGFVGKAHLNYQVKNFEFLYISVPDYGTVVISPERFLNSSEMKDALDHQTITVTTADNHQVQLTSESVISGKQKRSLYFLVDHTYLQPGNRPTVGYGFVSKAPYTWPNTPSVSGGQNTASTATRQPATKSGDAVVVAENKAQ